MTTPTILMVDDNPGDIGLVREAFAEVAVGINFVIAQDGEEALAFLKQVMVGAAARPAAILLDLNMPAIEGRNVLDFIKGTPELAEIPTIILSSSSSSWDKAECLEKRADAYMTKPNSVEQLDEFARTIYGMVEKGSDRTKIRIAPRLSARQGHRGN